MRSAGAGLLGALLMVAPLVAIPVMAVIGVPQFAPALSPTRWTDSFSSPVSTEEELAADLGEPEDHGSDRKTGNPRKSADDLYAPLPEADLSDPNAADNATAPAEAPRRPIKGDSRTARTAADTERARVRSNNAPRGSLGEWEVDSGWEQLTGDSAVEQASAQDTEPAELDTGNELSSAPPAAAGRGAKSNSRSRSGEVRLASLDGLPEAAPAAENNRTSRRSQIRPITELDGGAAANRLRQQPDDVDSNPGSGMDTADLGEVVEEDENQIEVSPQSTAAKLKTRFRSDLLTQPASATSRPAARSNLTKPVRTTPPPRETAELGDAVAGATLTEGNFGENSPDTDATTGDVPADGLTWTSASRQLQAWGIRRFRLESNPEDGQFLFVCYAPEPHNPKAQRRFETSAHDPLEAVRIALGDIANWYRERSAAGASRAPAGRSRASVEPAESVLEP